MIISIALIYLVFDYQVPLIASSIHVIDWDYIDHIIKNNIYLPCCNFSQNIAFCVVSNCTFLKTFSHYMQYTRLTRWFFTYSVHQRAVVLHASRLKCPVIIIAQSFLSLIIPFGSDKPFYNHMDANMTYLWHQTLDFDIALAAVA